MALGGCGRRPSNSKREGYAPGVHYYPPYAAVSEITGTARRAPLLPDRPGLGSTEMTMELHGLDTETEVFFYEQDYYILSNFSAFAIRWRGQLLPTSEHAYQWEKFAPGTKSGSGHYVRDRIAAALSAHDAFKLAESYKALRRPDWDALKVGIMRFILMAKARQHEYVRRKLLATGDRVLIENSWRDDFWGWGPNRGGQNMLGKLWMDVRAELRAEAMATSPLTDYPSEDCPHAAPHRYCAQCAVSPCPVGLDVTSNAEVQRGTEAQP